MVRQDVSFQTADDVTLRGWFFTSANAPDKVPCLVMSHGLGGVKEMDLDFFAEHFTSKLPIACLVYDHRGFGASDVGKGGLRQEVITSQQLSDFSDAITYAQSRTEVDPKRIGIWGTSYSGGHVLWLGAVDRRVRAVLSQVPVIDAWGSIQRIIPPHVMTQFNERFEQDRLARAAGQKPAMVQMYEETPSSFSVLPSSDAHEFLSTWQKKSPYNNEITLKSYEDVRAYFPASRINRIGPTPLLMTVAENDALVPTDLALQAYETAVEPKQIQILPGGHYDAYSGPNFERNAGTQVEFLRKWLVDRR